jgi:predicted transcriptional regulator
MSEDLSGARPNSILIVSELVAAYVSNNHVAATDLPALIQSMHEAVAGLTSGQEKQPAVEAEEMPTAAQIRRSVQHEGIVSFLDGKSYKTLKRHLTTYGLTPVTYRQRFGLRDDYPMVAPSYSERRSSLAKALGLGVRNGSGDRIEEVETPKKSRRAA